MTVQLPLQEGILTLEQWQHVEGLATSLSPEQARWISGYFAGTRRRPAAFRRRRNRARSPRLGQERSRSSTGPKPAIAVILPGALPPTAGERGLAATVADMSDYKVRQLKDEQDILFVISTYGEGDPPQPSVGFFEFLEGPRAPKLEGVRYSVLALGDSTYEKYCEAGKRIDRRLEELGASRLAPRVDCDIDYEEPAAVWSAALADLLAGELRRVVGGICAGHRPPGQSRSGARQAQSIRRDGAREYPHRRPSLDEGNAPCRARSVRLGPHATCPAIRSGSRHPTTVHVVEELLDAAGVDGATEVSVKGSSMSLASALTSRFEITTASPRLLEQWAKLSGASELEALLPASAAAERVKFLHDHHVVDIVRRFPVPGVEAEQLLAGLRPLQPRLYSIASSQAAVGDEAHLTVAPVRYQLHGASARRRRLHPDRRPPGNGRDHPRLYPGQPALPAARRRRADHHDRPRHRGRSISRLPPGARGCARAAGRSWLFFGERNLRSDFLYQIEWQQWLKDGVLSRLDVAFSRDGHEKVYVQQRMLEQAPRTLRMARAGRASLRLRRREGDGAATFTRR